MVSKNCLGLSAKRILPIESSWIFQLHALIAAETQGSQSFRRLRAGLESLEAQGASQGQHGSWPSNCLSSGSAARPSVEGPGCGPQGLREGIILTKNDILGFWRSMLWAIGAASLWG